MATRITRTNAEWIQCLTIMRIESSAPISIMAFCARFGGQPTSVKQKFAALWTEGFRQFSGPQDGLGGKWRNDIPGNSSRTTPEELQAKIRLTNSLLADIDAMRSEYDEDGRLVATYDLRKDTDGNYIRGMATWQAEEDQEDQDD